MTENTRPARLSHVLVHLLRGLLFRDQHPELWQDLQALQAQVIDYVAILGLELTLEDTEGYAYLRQQPVDEAESKPIPRLVQRRPLSYPVSLLCTLLRKKLAEADAGGGDSRVILSREDIVDMLRIFLPEQSNEARIVEQIDTHINKVVELGFLRKLKSDQPHYEVQRVLKALVDADWLVGLEEKIRTYREYADRTA